MNTLRGVGAALVTPFCQDGSIDWQAFERLLEHTHHIGVDYWVIQGTTGESPTVSPEEKRKLLDIARQHPAKKPIVLGLGGNHTQAIVQQLQQLDPNGITAILSVCPYYNKPSQEGLYQHFVTIAEHSPLPIVLYNVPSRTGCHLQAQTTLRLAKHPNIIGIKEASADWMHILHLLAHRPADFLILSGDDMLTPALVALGGDGVISVMANAFADFNTMVHQAMAGSYTDLHMFLRRLMPLNELLYAEGNPVGIKCVLAHMGICAAYVRLPLAPASPSLSARIKEQLQANNYIA